jgi:L-threonylcarbamoyladenylate synthase
MKQKEKIVNIKKIITPILLAGGIGVLPTDTLYGVCGSALKKKTVERIYKLRQRDLKKPMIVLISSMKDLQLFDIKINAKQKKVVKKLWPGKVSIVFDCANRKFEYLNREGKTLALRFPNEKQLLKILKKVGPLVAPSANMAGEKPAQTYTQAKKYFADRVDFYVDKGKLKSKPSTLIKIDQQGKIEVLRSGTVKIEKEENRDRIRL